MFKPMSEKGFLAALHETIDVNGSQQDCIKGWLQQACFHTFATNYKTAGESGVPDYDAPYFNAILATIEQLRGADVDAIARWIKAFAPVQIMSSGFFEIDKQKVDALSLYLLDDESTQINTFWAWAITPLTAAKVLGSADTKLYPPLLDWWLLDSNTKKAAKKSFLDSVSMKNRIESLIRDCVKAGMDESAALLRGVEVEVVAAAKMVEAKFTTA